MKRILVTAGWIVGSAGFASACPTWELDGLQSYEVNGAALYEIVRLEAVAGGENEMGECNLANIGAGFVATQPDVQFEISGLENYSRIEFSVLAECDAVLLMNDAKKSIRYSDDVNGTDPVIKIDAPANGTYDLWIGTIGPEECAAELFVEAF
ncbi:MAG: hypothetical protein AAGM84_14645 [Pseudomonadota bacterium]